MNKTSQIRGRKVVTQNKGRKSRYIPLVVGSLVLGAMIVGGTLYKIKTNKAAAADQANTSEVMRQAREDREAEEAWEYEQNLKKAAETLQKEREEEAENAIKKTAEAKDIKSRIYNINGVCSCGYIDALVYMFSEKHIKNIIVSHLNNLPIVDRTSKFVTLNTLNNLTMDDYENKIEVFGEEEYNISRNIRDGYEYAINYNHIVEFLPKFLDMYGIGVLFKFKFKGCLQDKFCGTCGKQASLIDRFSKLHRFDIVNSGVKNSVLREIYKCTNAGAKDGLCSYEFETCTFEEPELLLVNIYDKTNISDIDTIRYKPYVVNINDKITNYMMASYMMCNQYVINSVYNGKHIAMYMDANVRGIDGDWKSLLNDNICIDNKNVVTGYYICLYKKVTNS